MASKVEIANQALALIGQGSISSLDGTNTPERESRNAYAAALPLLLSANAWRFAEARQRLARVSTPVTTEYLYGYALPADCLKPIRLERSDGAHPSLADPPRMQITGRAILTDADPAVLVYTRQVDDPELLPPPFVSALAAEMAARMVGPVTKRADARELAQMAESRLYAAMASDQNQEVTTYRPTPDWIAGREGGSV